METKEGWFIMSMLYSEDAYGLGLLYAYIYAGKKMVLKEDLDKFHEIIEFNLRNMNYNEITPIWYDEEPSIYFASEGKNNEIYYVLYPDFDLKKAKSKYIGCLPSEILVASQMENALNSIDLKKENERIVRKKPNELKIPNCDFVNNAKVTEIFCSKDHKKLQKDVNEQIEKGRQKEAKAWIDAKNFTVNANQENSQESSEIKQKPVRILRKFK